jgi:hypothetical protein
MDLVLRQRLGIHWNSTLYADDPTATSFTGTLFVDIAANGFEIKCHLLVFDWYKLFCGWKYCSTVDQFNDQSRPAVLPLGTGKVPPHMYPSLLFACFLP